MGYAPLQRLVVAGFEMQAIDPLERAPVTAISHQSRGLVRGLARSLVRAGAGFIGAQRYQTAGHWPAVALRYEQQPDFGHVRGHAREEVALQVGRVAVLEVGALVAAVEEVPVGRADLG